MPKKLLIIGANGMLGQELVSAFSGSTSSTQETWDITGWDKDEIDITNEKQVHEKIAASNPDIIINAAAYTDVAACETKSDLAFAVNGEALLYLSQAAKNCGATLVHYSTDYVFDGKNESGYTESDEPKNSINEYGQSKLLGERLLREVGNEGLTYYLIRTSWLFGHRGKNFIENMLNLAKTKKEINVVNDQHGKPTFAKDLADATRGLLEHDYASGIYHLTNELATTWFDFAKEVYDTHAKLHPDFKKPKLKPCDSTMFPVPKRPKYSVLQNTKYPALRNWKDAVGEYLTRHE